MRVADTLARQLAALGLERVPQRVQTLDAYIASKYAGPNGDAWAIFTRRGISVMKLGEGLFRDAGG